MDIFWFCAFFYVLNGKEGIIFLMIRIINIAKSFGTGKRKCQKIIFENFKVEIFLLKTKEV